VDGDKMASSSSSSSSTLSLAGVDPSIFFSETADQGARRSSRNHHPYSPPPAITGDAATVWCTLANLILAHASAQVAATLADTLAHLIHTTPLAVINALAPTSPSTQTSKYPAFSPALASSQTFRALIAGRPGGGGKRKKCGGGQQQQQQQQQQRLLLKFLLEGGAPNAHGGLGIDGTRAPFTSLASAAAAAAAAAAATEGTVGEVTTTANSTAPPSTLQSLTLPPLTLQDSINCNNSTGDPIASPKSSSKRGGGGGGGVGGGSVASATAAAAAALSAAVSLTDPGTYASSVVAHGIGSPVSLATLSLSPLARLSLGSYLHPLAPMHTLRYFDPMSAALGYGASSLSPLTLAISASEKRGGIVATGAPQAPFPSLPRSGDIVHMACPEDLGAAAAQAELAYTSVVSASGWGGIGGASTDLLSTAAAPLGASVSHYLQNPNVSLWDARAAAAAAAAGGGGGGGGGGGAPSLRRKYRQQPEYWAGEDRAASDEEFDLFPDRHRARVALGLRQASVFGEGRATARMLRKEAATMASAAAMGGAPLLQSSNASELLMECDAVEEEALLSRVGEDGLGVGGDAMDYNNNNISNDENDNERNVSENFPGGIAGGDGDIFLDYNHLVTHQVSGEEQVTFMPYSEDAGGERTNASVGDGAGVGVDFYDDSGVDPTPSAEWHSNNIVDEEDGVQHAGGQMLGGVVMEAQDSSAMGEAEQGTPHIQ